MKIIINFLFYFFVYIMKKLLFVSLVLLSGILMTACENKSEENLEEAPTCSLWETDCETVDVENSSEEVEDTTENQTGIDYLILVNKQNKLPEDRESKIELVEVQNAYNENIRVEKEVL